mgnify:FL=1
MNNSPKNTLWLEKWPSSFLLTSGMAMTNLQIYPLNLYLHLFGLIGWPTVALCWHDRSLIVVNAVVALIFVNGIVISLI